MLVSGVKIPSVFLACHHALEFDLGLRLFEFHAGK